MKPVLLSALLLVLSLPAATLAAPLELRLGQRSLALQSEGGFAHARLTLVGPAGFRHEQGLDSAQRARFELTTSALADGEYRYRVDFSNPARGIAHAAEVAQGRAAGERGPAAPPALSGTFAVLDGAVILPGDASEPESGSGKAAGNEAKVQVVADDLIVQGYQIVQDSLCVGFACVDNETFNSDTVRLKEDNLRIHFDDTSVAAGFSANDWRLIANDQPMGGSSLFAIEDASTITRPFTVDAGTPDNALYLDSTGNVGLGTNTPGLDLSLRQRDTPAIRLEQSNAGGFTPQTWDIGGNEANFFVRDLTSGSRLSFRIRPGAPTSSLDISATGNVGIGTASPDAKLDIWFNQAAGTPVSALRVSNPAYPIEAQQIRFDVDSDGNVSARGAISQLSSRAAKHDFRVVDADRLLQRVRALPVTLWSYLGRNEAHLGPVAEDFHAAFGLGASSRMIAPADLAGVALAAVKALQAQVEERERRIEALERRLAEIEARLPR